MQFKRKRATDNGDDAGHKNRDYFREIIKLVTAVIIAYGGGLYTDKLSSADNNPMEIVSSIAREQADLIKSRVQIVETKLEDHNLMEIKDRELIEEKFKTVNANISALSQKIDILIQIKRGER